MPAAPDDAIDWDDAFANAPYIPGADGYPERWAARAAAFRAGAGSGEALDADLDIAYGAPPRCRLDVFRPSGDGRRQAEAGLLVFLHGGFWRRFDKSFWSHLARGPVAAGWTVAAPSYPLAPEARISEITRHAAAAVAAAARRVPGPIRLVGHSAGGHLAARLICDDALLAPETAARIAGVVSISGLHDLRPLLATEMNQTLALDAAEAAAESVILRDRMVKSDVVAWVGARERPEFLRQSALLAEAWDIELVADPGRNHFDVLEGLEDAALPLARRALGLA